MAEARRHHQTGNSTVGTRPLSLTPPQDCMRSSKCHDRNDSDVWLLIAGSLGSKHLKGRECKRRPETS